MKPNFALNLSFDGIGLLHRVPSGWHLVGEVSLEAPDLGSALSVLRQNALALDAAGLRCKLVIPNEQIRYLSRSVAPDADESEVRAALDGATPYAVDELAYDWTFEGGTLHIAAVAHETLAEAEAFALEHGFNPVSFVATPDQSIFPGEPFFGLTKAAPGIVGPSVPVARDLQPIRVIGHARLPLPPVETVPEPAPDILPNPVPDILPDPVPDTASDARVTDAPATPDSAAAAAPSQTDAVPDDAAQAEPPGPAEADNADVDIFAPPIAASMPPPFKFSSIRARPNASPPPGAVTTPSVAADSLRPRPAVPLPKARPERPDPNPPAPRTPLSPAKRRPVPGPTPNPAPAASRTRTTGLPAGTSTTILASLGRALRRPPRDKGAPPLVPSPRKTALELAQMTVFGARKPVPGLTAGTSGAIARGKPRYLGLGLTLALLIFLAGVAAWASLGSDTALGWLRGNEAPVQTAATAPDAHPDTADDGAIATRLITDDNLQDAEGPVDATLPNNVPDPDETEDLAALEVMDVETDALSDPSPPALSAPALPTPEEILARYAATGIWAVAPDAPTSPGQIDIDQVYIASIDPAIQPDDAVALPGIVALRQDLPPGPLSSPAAAGTLFRLDPRGLVEATPEGALTPDGVLVIAGRPPVTPPAGARAEEAPSAASTETPDARLAAFRPRTRPDNLSDGAERAVLGGLTRTELAAFRPRPRPASVTVRGEAAAVAAASAAAAAAAVSSSASTAGLAASPEARPPVVAGVKPRIRPEDLGVSQEATGRETAAAPGGISREEADDDEGEVQVASARGRTVTPSVPSQANVAKAATEKNVLNLREVNLIGVYGTQASRRALVRLSNGRYQKVKVGDRVDGGRVVAISDTELRYTKGGRNVTLTMPRS